MRSLLAFSVVPLAALAVTACGGGRESRAVKEPEPASEEPGLPDEIEALAAPLVDDGWTVGLTIGWIADGERGIVGLGSVEQGGERRPDGDTVVEIGSITKVFTSLALAAMVERGDVSLDTPVSELLPDVSVPAHDGEPITLEHLATHTSGLPRLPSNLEPDRPGDPYVDYDMKALAAFLEDYELTRAPGATYEYSNLGAGLLGAALAARAETSYEELVHDVVLDPLGLRDTAVRLSSDQADRLASGHAEGDEVPYWTFDALAGAGALRSTADDLLSLAQASFGSAPAPMAAVLEEARRARMQIPGGDWIALGWHIGLEARGGPAGVVWHNGGTGGFHSFLAFDPDREIAVVVLANSMQPTVEKLGVAVLRRLRGEPAGFEVPRLTEVGRDVLRRYVGVYQIAEGIALTVVREGDRLLAQVTGQPQFPIYPSSETEFFYRMVDARIAFDVDDTGKTQGLTLYQDGEAYEAPRTGDPPPRLDVVEVELDQEILDRYVGRYELTPELTLNIERKDDVLVAQITGQPALAIVPISETEFVYRDVDARLRFNVGDDGEATDVVLRQAGRELDGERLD